MSKQESQLGHVVEGIGRSIEQTVDFLHTPLTYLPKIYEFLASPIKYVIGSIKMDKKLGLMSLIAMVGIPYMVADVLQVYGQGAGLTAGYLADCSILVLGKLMGDLPGLAIKRRS